MTAGQRRLPLRGAVNFRDLGGYETADGRVIRWGRVFRSDSLAELSSDDVAQLQAKGICTVCDLRSEAERVQKPNCTLGSHVNTHAIGFMPEGGHELIAAARNGRVAAHEIEARVADLYRRFVTGHSASFARLFEIIANGDSLPLVFHCTSGKDRTGFAAAMLLTVLGVPRAIIEADYALSNDYRRDLSFQLGPLASTAVMSAVTQVYPSYLEAAFGAIDREYGSIDHYLLAGLGLDCDRVTKLKTRLLS